MNPAEPKIRRHAISSLLIGGIVLIGCGGCGSAGSSEVKTEEQARFQTIRKLGESNTKLSIVQAKKKAAAERKGKNPSKSAL